MKFTVQDFEGIDLDDLMEDDGACSDPECCPGGPSYWVSPHKLVDVLNKILEKKQKEQESENE